MSASVNDYLAAFSVGGIVSQLPLGMLSDKIGRRPVLLIALRGRNGLIFHSQVLVETSTLAVMAMFFIAGLFVGSIFSLGISYMSDLTPKELLPTGNLLCGMFLVWQFDRSVSRWLVSRI